MALLGVVFEFDQLSDPSPKAAFRLFFATTGRDLLKGCELFGGETRDATAGRTRQYCIGVSGDAEVLSRLRSRLAGSTERGLADLADRFFSDEQARSEPLGFAGQIDSKGELVNGSMPWLEEVWTGAAPSTSRAADGNDLAWAWRRLHAP
jgi:hypothetical protein